MSGAPRLKPSNLVVHDEQHNHSAIAAAIGLVFIENVDQVPYTTLEGVEDHYNRKVDCVIVE